MSDRPPTWDVKRWTLAVVCTATFMLLLDLTVVFVALSSIQTDFHSDLGSLQWVVDAYTVPLAGLLLTAGTLGDRIGRRRVFLAGMALFTAGSLGCALAWSSLSLDITRAGQGAGGALLFGVALPLLGEAFPQARERAGAIGAFGATMAAATAVGPLVGGYLVQGPGWRWIFLINVPIGLATLAGGRLRLRESRGAAARGIDASGAVLLTAGLFALMLAVIRGNDEGWASAPIRTLFAAAAILLAALFVRELRAGEPMLDLRLFGRPSFLGVAVAVFAMMATLVAAMNYTALYVANTLGYGPSATGLRFLPLTIASFVAAPVTAALADRVPPRLTVGGSLLLTAAGLALTARLDADSRWTALVAGFVVAGIGLGAGSAATSNAALSLAEPARAGMATGMVNTMRQVGLATGVAVLGAVFQRRATDATSGQLASVPLPHDTIAALSEAVGSGAGAQAAAGVPGPLRRTVVEAARAATASGLNDILRIGAIAAAVCAVVALATIRRETPTEESAVRTAPATADGLDTTGETAGKP
ncbi:MFS transporter [Streptomyces sp. NPDC002677]|uniref:MFS transporter n=1 Tax=Streptomyces sp. NPDC002677 TaxID=3154774 RepID=UPI00331C676C